METQSSDPTLVILKEGKIRPLSDIIDEVIQHALDYYEGNRYKVAEDLQVGKSTLYRKVGPNRPKNRDMVLATNHKE